MVKSPPANAGDTGDLFQSLGREDPLDTFTFHFPALEKEMATHFLGILAWEIPWPRSMVGYSPWGHKELDMT